MDFAALEFDDFARLEAKPVFLVAVDRRQIARFAQAVSGRRASAANQTKVFIFRVDDAHGPVLLAEFDGEETALGFVDQLFDGFHISGLCLCLLLTWESVEESCADGKEKD